MGLAHLCWEHDFGHLTATMLSQLEAKMTMMSGGPKLCSHHRPAGPSLALYRPPGRSNIAILRPIRPSTKAVREKAMGLAHSWWEKPTWSQNEDDARRTQSVLSQ